MQIFHIATAADWARARETGAYETSTRGVTLQEEGFIHCSRRDQVDAVFSRYYADAGEPLLLLTIDTDRLTSEWRWDPVGEDVYPHVYGPIDATAVVMAQPLTRRGRPDTMMSAIARDVALRAVVLIVAMLLAWVGAKLAVQVYDGDWSRFVGAIAGLVVGVGGGMLLLRRD